MRVLMVSKACIHGAYQRKLEELARCGAELTVVVPPSWRDHGGQVFQLDRRHTQGYRLAVEPLALNGHFHTHFYPRLGRSFRGQRWDVVTRTKSRITWRRCRSWRWRSGPARAPCSSPGRTYSAAIRCRCG